MPGRCDSASRFDFRALIGAAVLCTAMPAGAAPNYVPITPAMSDRTVALNGRDLTIDQIVMVARHGAKVELSAEARQHQADSYGLLLEAAGQGSQSAALTAAEFLKTTAASTFYRGGGGP